ncbi:NRAMP-like transporter smf-3 [Yamadazyma tenuis]|uniref:Vacuolar metal transporter n=1 Tax=Candida tenuis (strain ATCC 10573 / BCRC 21748 / CBS 615 / JCM 9827 / NBRC 10315 / NRRL Y-1498 / VKM Y-70) TaxID=590646 RepID=G3AZ34_CANTC|nr:vacuolar metal transporter [Yamadazyma tenuis ATCC 10573]EGV65996.1 vacuolar metal transporter [Yamadazyma tenuis ATCC 10573]WEJ95664.1 NRAMP-like transporter smf-3 [Yamadazyma tenuis]
MNRVKSVAKDVIAGAKKYASFVGPGIMVSVAYMDPGNYSTAVSSGAMYEYKLLFIIFMSNLFAVILQCLCVKLGTITGLDLAEMCRLHLNPNLNLALYFCAELAIIATDLAEVVGTAISLEILFGIPLFYGVLITILDVLIILMVYHKDGSMKQTRLFEILVSILVLATCLCFILELFKCDFPEGALGGIIKGVLPVNGQIFKEQNALFLSCGIVGSTVMPHSLFLGSALVQSRLKDYDIKHGFITGQDSEDPDSTSIASSSDQELHATIHKFRSISDGTSLSRKYRPSYEAIKYSLNYSYTELVLSLFIIAVFVNSAILIVAGSSLFGKPDADNADLLSIYQMLSYYISPAAGLIFALSMLFSGQSAGIVCTMAGQIISEGFINWSVKPWLRRIITRVLAIVPVLFFIGILGREGVSKIMNSSQVVLSFILPVVSAPLIYFTCKKEYLTVFDTSEHLIINENTALLTGEGQNSSAPVTVRKYTFENGKVLTIASVLTWLIISSLNFYLIIAFANGADI